jgi:ankyrin repeat protein
MGASPNAPDSQGMTPLHYAAAAGCYEVVKLLIEYGGNADVASNLGDTALSLAVANGRVEAMKLLLTPRTTSANNRLGTHRNENGHGSPNVAHQKLSLLVSLSSCCSDCGNMQNHYVVSTIVSLIQFQAF